MAAADLNEAEVYLPAAGSTFYYASLYFPARVQHELRLLEALRRTITSIPAACSDRGVAIMKLAWWHAEIDALAQGQARHALTRELLPLVAAEPTLITAYADLVRGTDASIGADLPPDAAALDTRLIATHGGVVRAFAARGGLDDDAQTDAILRLAALVERAQLLHALYEQRRSGLIPLAGDVLTRHGLDLAAIRHGEHGASLHGVLIAECSALREQIRTTLDTLPRAARRRQRLFVTLARIACRHLELSLQDDCRLLERRLETTPLERLWVAWRTHRLG